MHIKYARPRPVVPVGIGFQWLPDINENFETLLFSMFSGSEIYKASETISKELLQDEMCSAQVVQALADRAVVALLHKAGEKLELIIPIKERLKRIISVMKSHADCSNSLETKHELKFFLDYIEGYVLEISASERTVTPNVVFN